MSRIAPLARAAAVLAANGAAAEVLWRVHPGATAAPGPDSDVVTACAWIAWAVGGYLCLAVVLAVLDCIRPAPALARFAPATIRRLVQVVVSAGLVATVATTSANAATAASTRPAPSAHPGSGSSAPSLDWPGLAPDRTGTTNPRTTPDPRAGYVLVRPGDTLWTIAARHLGPDAATADIATAWPTWWHLNRAVIGADPDLIRPGQRLAVPTTRRSQR